MMKRLTHTLWSPEEYHYQAAFGFLPRLDGYLHEDITPRPCIIIAPGGGYRRCSPTEGECVALHFYEMGYQAFVCSYTANPLENTPLNRQPALDLARAVRYVRQNTPDFGVDGAHILLCGFSAGGHLAATVGVHADELDAMEQADISCRPDGLILCYPVIQIFSPEAHPHSGPNLLGPAPDEAALHWFRPQENVSSRTPPTFLWHTRTDNSVPFESSRLFAEACEAAGVPCKLVLFPEGKHGLALADGPRLIGKEAAYPLGQTACVLRQMEADGAGFAPELREKFLHFPEVALLRATEEGVHRGTYAEDVRTWPDLAHTWLNQKLAEQ